MHAYMNAICVFHNVCGDLGIDVDARIESLELFREEELAALREELRRKLRNGRGSDDGTKTVRNAHWKSRLIAVCNYIVWRANPVIDRMSLRDERLPEARRRLEALPKRLVGKIVVRENTSKEGMDEKIERAFLDAITPGHPSNPFNRRNQVRNQALSRRATAFRARNDALAGATGNGGRDVWSRAVGRAQRALGRWAEEDACRARRWRDCRRDDCAGLAALALTGTCRAPVHPHFPERYRAFAHGIEGVQFFPERPRAKFHPAFGFPLKDV